MLEITQKEVFHIIRDSFENMAFLDVDEDNDQNDKVEELSQIFCLKYEQPDKGLFMLLLPKRIKFILAENIYGSSLEDLLPNQIDDSLLEILNVIGGRLLLELFGKSTKTVLGLPYIAFEEIDIPKTIEKSVFRYHVDDMKFQFVWVKGEV